MPDKIRHQSGDLGTQLRQLESLNCHGERSICYDVHLGGIVPARMMVLLDTRAMTCLSTGTDVRPEEARSMEIALAIKTAQQAVVEAGLPTELQSVAFAEVLRHCLGEPVREVTQDERPGPRAAGTEAPGLARLAARAKVTEVALADVFEIDEDHVSLHVASSRISSVKRRATVEIALLIASARQASGVDDGWTAATHIRDTLQRYGRYDTSNFSAYLRNAADSFNYRGKATSLELRLTQYGWETALELVRSLAGEIG